MTAAPNRPALGTTPYLGPVILYRPGRDNWCPSCTGMNWMVGRMTAECGYCGTALAIADDGRRTGEMS